MFDQRSYKLFEEILKHDHMTKTEVIRTLDLSERQFNYDFEKINEALLSIDIPQIEMSNQFFIIDPEVIELMHSELPLDINANQIVISEEDRVFLIYLYTFIRKESISNYHYQLMLGVSKNTALTDVKKTKQLCAAWGIELVYTRMDGYHLEGSELDKRRLSSYCIDYLLTQPLGKEIIMLSLKSWGQDECFIRIQELIDAFLKAEEIKLVKSRKAEMILHLTFISVRNKGKELFFTEYEKQLIRRQSLFEKGTVLAQKLFEREGIESFYVTIELLIAQEEVKRNDNPALEELAEQIIKEFEMNTLLPIKNKKALKQSLYNHLVPAFFRISFESPLVNTLTTRIKNEYTELFQFVKKSLAPLSMWTGKNISESEIGFFTLHFGGYLEMDKSSNAEKLNALIVCSNGVSSSIMLRSQLSEMFPDIQFSRVHTAEQIHDIPTISYDLLFSTLEIESVKPVYIVKPLLSHVEKNYLIQAVSSKFPRLNYRNFSVDQLMEVINKHTVIKDEQKLFSELVNLFYLPKTEKGSYKPMLSELLTKDMIQFTDQKLEWREAISGAAQPLLDANKIQQEYTDEMIKNVEEIGTYIHIGKGIAIPHARPESGVKQLGMSFLRTKSPVLLLDKKEHEIDVFICLAAIDNEAHLKALAQLTKLLGDDIMLQSIKEAETAEEIIKIIEKGEGK
ncbi:PTS system ascorbate-specific IIA component [Virgibacillus natechei]|uniref:Ascorbate-specific PTS system EIIA component n=1 Tax=Virgibacillus natechei TaxID=1216297 RepID=A0ABS4IHQ3_9BACI|nr:BglG family transcription antiterminator [Virgibacillus natechei]MBP1970489.1 PTS system ascorbate-specific IIA component [Virgibacillus natechei]UZD14105.1 BglG family transcription antiterminator [Virgibacillus natechei]